MRSRELFCIALLSIVAAPGVNAAEWIPGPPLNIARGHLGACVDPCGNIYVVGGSVGIGIGTDSVEMLAFDELTGYAKAWVSIASLNIPRVSHSVVCVNGFIYAIGGTDPFSVERLDTTAVNPTWDAIAVLPPNIPRGGHGATVDKWGRIWVIGGTLDPLVSVEIFDPARPQLGWTFGPPLNVARAPNGYAGVVTDRMGRIYVIGGATGEFGTHIATVERINPCDPDPQWVVVSDIIGRVSNTDKAVLGADGKIYVAGGWLPGPTNRVVRYDPNIDMWQTWVSLNEARTPLALALGKDGRIFAIGGEGPGFQPLTTVEILTAPTLGDLTGPDGVPDGCVDAYDLAAVLGPWCSVAGGNPCGTCFP